ncbi:MAG: hypothetical protein KJP00_13985 [Bacteroidia bacterium]|nr:hypothetical protein [Bacteroidia bacterium]
MKSFILITAVVELIAGLLLFFHPSLIPNIAGADANHFNLLRMYGAAAIGMGLFAFFTWQQFSNEALVSTFLIVILVFHICVAIASNAVTGSGLFADLNVTILHALLGLVTAYFWLKNKL